MRRSHTDGKNNNNNNDSDDRLEVESHSHAVQRGMDYRETRV